MDISSLAAQAVATQKAQTTGSINNAIAKKQFQAKQDFANLIAETSKALQDAASSSPPGLGSKVNVKA